MGKGRIVGGGDAGLYQVELMYDRARIDARMNLLEARVSTRDAEIATMEGELAAAQAAISSAASQLLEIINEIRIEIESLNSERADISQAIAAAEAIL